MHTLPHWDDRAWKAAASDLCHRPVDVNHTGRRALAYELAEVFSADLAKAVTAFPDQVMRAWRIDQDEILQLIDRKSPISQGTPRWREVEVELARICLSAIEADLCRLCHDARFAEIDLQLYVRRVCFEEVFGFFFFLLKP